MAKIKADFTECNDEFASVTKPGTYLTKITKAELKKSAEGKAYISWELTVATGEAKGAKLWYNTSLLKQALFNLRNFLTHAGMNIPKSTIQVDTDMVVGKMVNVVVVFEKYNGEEKAKVKQSIAAKAAKNTSDVDEDVFDPNSISDDEVPFDTTEPDESGEPDDTDFNPDELDLN